MPRLRARAARGDRPGTLPRHTRYDLRSRPGVLVLMVWLIFAMTLYLSPPRVQ